MEGSKGLDHLYSGLLDACDATVRQLLFATALAPLSIYREDLSEVSELSAEDLDQAINSRASRGFVETLEQFGAIHVQIFHASLRDYLITQMARIGLIDTYSLRLHRKLLKDAIAVYGRLDGESVTERDAAALHYSRKLRLYEPLLRQSDETRQIAIILLNRIDSLRFGGRSFSLYSLLVLARANALSISSEDGERFLKVLHTVIGEDSFLHAEYAVLLYAVLLFGVIISMASLNLHPEAVQTCKRRISLVARLPKQHVKSKVADLVESALKEGSDPLKKFELDEMLPQAYFETTALGAEDLESAEFESQMTQLIQTPVSEWTPEQRQMMDRYIRFTEVKVSI